MPFVGNGAPPLITSILCIERSLQTNAEKELNVKMLAFTSKSLIIA